MININKSVLGAAFLLSALVTTSAMAQNWSKAQSAVWDVVLASYEDIKNGDATWSEKWVLPNAMVWGGAYPMPRSRDSVMRWDSYQIPNSKTHVADYSPTAIVVHDSTAVAHYYYSSATESKDGERETTHGRCTDILAKEKGKWRFISWHCSDNPDND